MVLLTLASESMLRGVLVFIMFLYSHAVVCCILYTDLNFVLKGVAIYAGYFEETGNCYVQERHSCMMYFCCFVPVVFPKISWVREMYSLSVFRSFLGQ